MPDSHVTEAGAVADVAGKLTEAQRRSILHAYQTRKPASGQQFWTVDITCQPWPEGIAHYRSPNTDTLTPLGLAVRQHLEQGATEGIAEMNEQMFGQGDG